MHLLPSVFGGKILDIGNWHSLVAKPYKFQFFIGFSLLLLV